MQNSPLRIAAIGLLSLLAGCQTTPSQPTVLPELKLLESAALELPRDGIASGSFVVAFTVAASGRTEAIRTADAPPCVGDALTAWVASFRYEPPRAATSTSLEWMLVTAKRGS